MDEAEYCDRVAIMSEGKIVALDTPTALKSQYGADSMDGVFLKIARNSHDLSFTNRDGNNLMAIPFGK